MVDKLNSEDFYKNFDALVNFNAKEQFITKNLDVVGWLDRIVEVICSAFSSDAKYSPEKYNYQEVAKNINQFVQNYVSEENEYFNLQARNPQGVQKIERIVSNLLLLQKRFTHNKTGETAEVTKEIFKSSIEKLIQILPEGNSWKNLIDSKGNLSPSLFG